MVKRKKYASVEIRKLERKRAEILDQLLSDTPLLAGSLSLVMRRCGKANCHCARRPAHPVWVLSTRRKGKASCQVIRRADVEKTDERVRVYKKFKAALKRLSEVEIAEKSKLLQKMKERHVPYE